MGLYKYMDAVRSGWASAIQVHGWCAVVGLYKDLNEVLAVDKYYVLCKYVHVVAALLALASEGVVGVWRSGGWCVAVWWLV